MPIKQKKQTTITVESALSGVGRSARSKAFRRRRPVAVSIEGQAYLIYKDGRQVAVTPKLLRALRNGQA